MNAKERLYAWLRAGAFDERRGCRHPQDVIALAIGCSERTVIRCVQELEREGRLRVERPRRRGACNTYFVDVWNPSKRSGVLNVLREIRPEVLRLRAKREAKCHMKRTAAPSRAQSSVAGPQTRALTPRCYAVEGPTTVVARRENRCPDCGFELQEANVKQNGHVSDLTCFHCAEKDAELERKAGIIRALQFEVNRAMEAEAAANEIAKAAGHAAVAAKVKRTVKAREDAEAEDIERLLDFWLESHPKAQVPAGGKRWEVCKKALRLMKGDDAGPVEACLEALEGVRLFPFMDMKTFQRHSELAGGRMKRKDDVEHALGDEVRIGKARLLAQWARADKAERCWLRYQWATMTAEMWLGLCMEGLEERRRFSVAEMVNGHGNGSGEGS